MSNLTAEGINKIATLFINSLSHATYTLDETEKTIGFVRTIITNNIVKIYIWFDDTIAGEIGNVAILDIDNDIVAVSTNIYTKTTGEGLYVSFKYQLTELEV